MTPAAHARARRIGRMRRTVAAGVVTMFVALWAVVAHTVSTTPPASGTVAASTATTTQDDGSVTAAPDTDQQDRRADAGSTAMGSSQS